MAFCLYSPLPGLEILFRARPALIYNQSIFTAIPARPTVDDLAGFPFIGFSPGQALDCLGYYAQDSRLQAVIAKNSAITVNNNSMLICLVQQGLGVGIIDEFCLKSSLADKGTLASELMDHLLPERLYGILTRPGKKMSPQCLELIRQLRAHFMDQRNICACPAQCAKWRAIKK